jgi:hypothetical protein
MSRTTKIALAVALILNTVVAASAATKKGKSHDGARAQTAVDPLFSARDSPATTGGGSIGYNQNVYNW